MAKALDLEEQEQLDQIKHFWKKYGNLISWVLIVILGAYAAWNGYQYWQRDQAAKAAVLFDEVERSASAGDLARVQRSLADIKDKYAGTLFAHQASLLAAKFLSAQGKTAEAQAALNGWLAQRLSPLTVTLPVCVYRRFCWMRALWTMPWLSWPNPWSRL